MLSPFSFGVSPAKARLQDVTIFNTSAHAQTFTVGVQMVTAFGNLGIECGLSGQVPSWAKPSTTEVSIPGKHSTVVTVDVTTVPKGQHALGVVVKPQGSAELTEAIVSTLVVGTGKPDSHCATLAAPATHSDGFPSLALGSGLGAVFLLCALGVAISKRRVRRMFSGGGLHK